MDSNPRPLERKSPLITTRPGHPHLSPSLIPVYLHYTFDMIFSLSLFAFSSLIWLRHTYIHSYTHTYINIYTHPLFSLSCMRGAVVLTHQNVVFLGGSILQNCFLHKQLLTNHKTCLRGIQLIFVLEKDLYVMQIGIGAILCKNIWWAGALVLWWWEETRLQEVMRSNPCTWN